MAYAGVAAAGAHLSKAMEVVERVWGSASNSLPLKKGREERGFV
jgi:hypothetical protein